MMGENLLVGYDINRPSICEKCGGTVKYEGVGEYACIQCGFIMYDDYGKVRNYLETHKGATQYQVSEATGVSTAAIRHMLKDDRIEVSANSAIFLTCEACGKSIRSGRFCDSCQARRANSMQKASAPRNSSIKGFGASGGEAHGAMRFNK